MPARYLASMHETKLNPLEEAHIRNEKLQSLIDAGIATYPAASHRTCMVVEARTHFDTWSAELKKLTLCGRILTIRIHGGLIFFNLQDASGAMQGLLKLDTIGEEQFNVFQNKLDPADFVQITGTLFTTNRGEQTLLVSEWTLLAKAVLPLPDKFHGLKDPETRFRQRELDLISNPDVKVIFKKRSHVIRALRAALDAEGFEEVETPILQTIPGGTSAKPFLTHHNALDIDIYLRIAPELFLKRLIVGGFEKIYELGRIFRNEGIDWSHNPEFTELEFYWAYQEYRGLMVSTEQLLQKVIQDVNGSLQVTYNGNVIDFTGPWPIKKFRDAIQEKVSFDIAGIAREKLIGEMKKLKIDCDYVGASMGKLFDELYKEVVRKPQVQPLFIIDYPLEMEPLAKRCDDDPRFVQRFQLLVGGGIELCKAYSELNDPIDQLNRFEEQQVLRDKGDDEAQMIDAQFITALKHGLPPTAGLGMGIDRFVMLLTNASSLKEVILFPTMRPQNPEI